MSDGPWPEGIPEPRDQHYRFVYKTLPGLLFHAPEQMLALVAEHGAEPLRALWQLQADTLGPSATAVEPDGLAGELLPIDGVGPMAVITMPAPACPPEAYFAAAVCLFDNGPSEQRFTVRYLTLERTVETPDNVGNEPTIIGEWTADGMHINYGAGPRPTRDEFIAAVRALVLRLPPYDGPPEASGQTGTGVAQAPPREGADASRVNETPRMNNGKQQLCDTCHHDSTAHGNPKGIAWKDSVPMPCNRQGCACQDYSPRGPKRK